MRELQDIMKEGIILDKRIDIFKGSAITLLSLLMMQIVIIGSKAIFTRLFSTTTEYSIFSLLFQILFFSGIFIAFGLNHTLVYNVSRRKERTSSDRVSSFVFLSYSSVLVIGSVITVIVMVLAPLISVKYGYPEIRVPLRIASLFFVFNGFNTLHSAMFVGRQRFRQNALFLFISIVLMTILSCLFLYLSKDSHYRLVMATFGIGLGSLLAAMAGFYIFRNEIKSSWRSSKDKTRELRKMFSYGLPMWFGHIIKVYQFPFLLIIVGIFHITEVGFLENAYALTLPLALITLAFLTVAFPSVSETQNNKDRIQRSNICFRYNNYYLLPLTLWYILFYKEIVSFIFPEEYIDSAKYVPVIVIGMSCSSVSRLGSAVLAGLGKSKDMLFLMLIPALVTFIGVPVALTLFNSTYGATIIFSLGWFLAAITALILMRHRKVSINLGNSFLRPLVLTILVLPTTLMAKIAAGPFSLFLIAFSVILFLSLTLIMEKQRTLSNLKKILYA